MERKAYAKFCYCKLTDFQEIKQTERVKERGREGERKGRERELIRC